MGLPALRAHRRVAAVACGLALSPGAPAQHADPVVIVTQVLDGDTIKVHVPEGPLTVRLRNIDAPELNQPGGGAAARALHARVTGREVTLRDVTRESEERWVAVVLLGDENVNAWMVKQGHAWADRGHVREPDYCAWEQGARALRRGLWADRHWTAPWDWRLSKKDSTHFVSDYSNATSVSCMRSLGDTPAFDE